MKRTGIKAKRNRARDAAEYALREAVRKRDRGRCRRCSEPGTEVAHIISRRNDIVRCELDNCALLCGPCHLWMGDSQYGFDGERRYFVEAWIGAERYTELLELANSTSGLKPVFDDDYWNEQRLALEGNK